MIDPTLDVNSQERGRFRSLTVGSGELVKARRRIDENHLAHRCIRDRFAKIRNSAGFSMI
jgi:hypothetical protein